MRQKPPLILVGITEVAGYCDYLVQGLEACHASVIGVVLHPAPQFSVRKTSGWWINYAQFIGRKATKTPRSAWMAKVFWSLCLVKVKLALLLWAMVKVDVFIFTFGRSFFPFDLWLLKKLNKKVVIILNGSDSRPPYLNAKFNHFSPTQLGKVSQKIKRFVRYLEAYSDAIVAVSHQGYFHEKPLYMGLAIGQPSAPLSGTFQIPSATNSDQIRVFHSSSATVLKGTREIGRVVQALQEKGYPIAYIEVQNTPHEQLLALMASCDIVIDQLYADCPHSMQSIEAMALGKAVIVGGYYAELIKDDVPSEFIPPNLFILPEDLESCLETLIQSGAYRELGVAAKRYATEYLDNRVIAERFLAIISGTAPSKWRYNPAQNRYLYGIGLEKKGLQTRLKCLIETCGTSALCLSDKPELEARMVEFAFQKKEF